MTGTLIAGAIGLAVAGPLGLILGIAIGYWFDRSLRGTTTAAAGNLARIQQAFFRVTFLLAGYVAKADGRVSREEIDHTEAVFRQLNLSGEQRARAIELFRHGAAQDFDPEPELAEFLRVSRGQRTLTRALLSFLVSLAFADAHLAAAERDAVHRIGVALGFSTAELDELLRMVEAQTHFHPGDDPGRGGDRLTDAYEALGVDPGATDAEVKRAYRKRMSENHPDKLMARGVPDEMIKLATERSQEIQGAYDLIQRTRKARSG